MDTATLIGMIGAFVLVAMAMLVGGGIMVFVNVQSILIVFGGTLFVVMMKFNIGQYLTSFKVAMKAFFTKSEKPEVLINLAVDLATKARASGILALENEKIPNGFMQRGVNMLIDGQDAEIVRGSLNKDMMQTIERHKVGQGIFEAMGDVAPAMGMIGTLIGLVLMLSNMSDPSSIGPAMAVALLTTLYGAILANMIMLPIADKLKLRSKEERLNKSLIIDALMAIQSGQNPKIIEEMLKNYLSGAQRETSGSKKDKK